MGFILEGKDVADVRYLSSKEKGDEGERLVSGVLRKFRGELMTNVYLPYCGDVTRFIEIDNIFITPYKVFIVETKYGGGKKSTLKFDIKDAKRQVKKQKDVVSYYLSGVRIKLEPLIVLAKRERYEGCQEGVKVFGFTDFTYFISNMCGGGNKGLGYRVKNGKGGMVEEGLIRGLLLEQYNIYKNIKKRKKGDMLGD